MCRMGRCGHEDSGVYATGVSVSVTGVGVSMALTYSPVASSWVEKVRVESIWFGQLLQMVTNTADLQCTGDECTLQLHMETQWCLH